VGGQAKCCSIVVHGCRLRFAILDLPHFLLLLRDGDYSQCWLAGSEPRTCFAAGGRSALHEQEQERE
jgi:hypothetical protein